jgi:hypothetical protein
MFDCMWLEWLEDFEVYNAGYEWQTDREIMNRNSRSFAAFGIFTMRGLSPGG